MELTSPHKHIKNTSTRGKILMENYLETGRRTPIQPKLQERFPHNWVRMEKMHRVGTSTPGRDLKEKEGLHRQTLALGTE